jgi:hypothetical protein
LRRSLKFTTVLLLYMFQPPAATTQLIWEEDEWCTTAVPPRPDKLIGRKKYCKCFLGKEEAF